MFRRTPLSTGAPAKRSTGMCITRPPTRWPELTFAAGLGCRNTSARFQLREHPLDIIFVFEFGQFFPNIIGKKFRLRMAGGLGVHDAILEPFKCSGLGAVAHR